MTLPSICAPSPIRRSEARTSPLIRPKPCAGPLHSMLPTIDMPEPMQEPVPAFVVGSGLAPACSTTECCCCTVLSMTSAAFAAAFLSFSGALLLKLLNMSTSRFRRHPLRERAKAVFLRSSASWRRAFYSPRGETLRLGRHLRTGLRKRELDGECQIASAVGLCEVRPGPSRLPVDANSKTLRP